MINATRNTYFAPYDNAEQALIDLVASATKKILLADYSYNLENLTQLLIQKHQSGLDVSLVLDKTQAAGSTEKPEVAQLRAAGVPMVIGTSNDHHKIMHSKFVVVDDVTVGSGSYNFTTTAEHEDNFLDIEHNVERAQAFTDTWTKMHDWIVANEPQ